jgi:hypothetical protein
MRALPRFLPALLVAACLGGCKGEMTQPQISITGVVTSITVDGEPANITLEDGALPTETATPVIDATVPVATINGGSFEIQVTSADAFSEVVVGLPDTPDYFRISLPTARSSAKVLVTLDPGVRGGPMQMFIAGGVSPAEVGPYLTRAISVMRVGSGDVQVSVAWNSAADVDLHVVDPAGEEIYFASRTSASGGELDLDSNAACGSDQPRNENTVWPVGQAPSGTYIVRLAHWSSCNAPQTDYVVTIWVKGQDPRVFSGTFTGPGEGGGEGAGILIATFTK